MLYEVITNHPDLHDRIVFTGFTSRISEYLCRCQIGVLCSTPEFQEGLSNSLLEYMAHGLVPVATDLGGSREVIDDGVNGFLFHAGRADELCSIVTRLRHDNELFGRVQLQARATIRNRYSP